MIKNIPIYLRSTFDNIPRNEDLKESIQNICTVPDKNLLIDWNGSCFLCHCEAWLPVSVGNIDEFSSLHDVWESKISRSIRIDVADKHFTYCAVDRCGILDGHIYFDKHHIHLNIDESCNLQCPSCRTGLIMKDSGPEYDQKLSRARHIMRLLEEFDQPCHIIMSGNGDPLASAIMRPLIHDFRARNDQTFRLFTNGLLLKKQLEKSPILPNITQYFISIDAGSADVYHQVRRPGRWDVLMSNLEFLSDIVNHKPAEVLLKFVLQKDNWKDMINFCELCMRFGFQGVINRLENWGTWEEFAQQDVIGNGDHPEHLAAIDELKKIYQGYKNRIHFNSSLKDLAER